MHVVHASHRLLYARAWLPALLLAVAAGSGSAQAVVDDWCRARDAGRHQHCEIRQARFTPVAGTLDIDVGPNGSIEVEGYAGSDVRVTARVTVRARDESAARALAGRVEVNARGRAVTATGPRTSGLEGWTVSVRVQVPHGTDVSARSTNGTITINGTRSGVNVRTTNGAIRIGEGAGRVEARSTNGSITASVAGGSRPFEGALLQTTNGSVQLTLPRRTPVRLELTTTNGSITADVPETVVVRSERRRMSATVAGGGPEVRVSTTNGSIRVSGT